MGAAALALIPLIVSGYLFILLWYRMRFLLFTVDGQRLFFSAAAAGMVLAAFAFPLYGKLATGNSRLDEFVEYYPMPYAGQLMATMVLGIVAGLVASLVEGMLHWVRAWRTKDWHGRGRRPEAWLQPMQDRVIRAYTNPMKQLLLDAFEREQLVMLTLSSRKVYCGVLLRFMPLLRDGDQYIRIIPMFSAHRDKDNLELRGLLRYEVFDAWRVERYLKVLSSMLQAYPAHQPPISDSSVAELRGQFDRFTEEWNSFPPKVRQSLERSPIEHWAKVIPLDEVEIASLFDEDAYQDVVFRAQTANPDSHGVAPAAPREPDQSG